MKIQTDLSGIAGLAPRYFGDKPYSASKPNLRYLGADGQMAEGIYNPISVLGYMSPANDTTKAVTGTTSFLLSSAVVVPSRIASASTNAIFFSDEATGSTLGKVVGLDTPIDTSLDVEHTLTGLQDANYTFTTNFASATDAVTRGFRVNPSGAAFPTLNTSTRNVGSTGATHTFSFTVPPSLTNSVLVVHTFAYSNPGSPQITSITWNGTAMTNSGQGAGTTGSLTWSFGTFKLAAPANATGNIVITWTASVTTPVAYALLYTGAAQTGQITDADTATVDTGTTVSLNIDSSADWQTRVAATISRTNVTHTAGNEIEMTEIFNATNGTGKDSLFTVSTNGDNKIEDMILYQVDGTPKIFYAIKSNEATLESGGIGIADVDFSNPNDDWLTNDSSGGNKDMMALEGRSFFTLADNGNLYAFSGNRVHKIDGGPTGGTNGTVTESVLLFLGTTVDNSVTILKDAMDLKGRMWIGLHVNSDFDSENNDLSTESLSQFVGVYVWDRVSVVASMSDFVEISGARELISMHKFKGIASCFTISTDGYSEFRTWDGSKFKVTKPLGKNAHPVYRRHSVYEDTHGIYWFGKDGKVYFYGSVGEGFEDALYIIGDMTGHVTSNETFVSSGVMVAANATETVTSGVNTTGLGFYLSFTDTAGNHLKKWYPFGIETIASNAQKGHIGNVYSLVRYLPKLSTVNNIVVYCAPTGTGTDTIATLKIYFNQSTSVGWTETITENKASKGYIHIPVREAFVNSIQFEVEHSTTETLGENTFRPSVGIIDYTPVEIDK